MTDIAGDGDLLVVAGAFVVSGSEAESSPARARSSALSSSSSDILGVKVKSRPARISERRFVNVAV